MKRWQIGAIVLFFALWILSSFGGGDPATSFSARPNGVKAFFLLLEQQRKSPKRWFYPFTELQQKQKKGLLIAASISSFGAEEMLLDWVAEGNGLLFFDSGSSSSEKLLQKIGVERDETDRLWQFNLDDTTAVSSKSTPSHPTDPLYKVATISTPKGPSVKSFQQAEVLIGDDDGFLAFKKAHGKGDIWYFAGADPLRNRNIDKEDNLRLLFQITSRYSEVWFDEYHHGFRPPVKNEIKRQWSSIYLFLGVSGSILALLALSRGVRFGEPLPSLETRKASTMDFVSVLGLLYWERGTSSVLKWYIENWRRRVENTFGISRRLDEEKFLLELRERKNVDNAQGQNIREALAGLRTARDGESNRKELESDIKTLERIFG